MKKIILINFIIIFSIILLLEFTINSFKLSGLMGIQKGLINPNDKLHFFIPNSSGIIFDKKVFIDKNGFRVPKQDFNYNGTKNVFFIGDSTTFGNGVLEENSFVGLLRKNFSNINFFNSSVPGYQIKHHIINLDQIKKFKNKNIDKIIYVFTLNDVMNSANIIDLKNKKEVSEGSYKIKEIKFINNFNIFLRNKSYLYMYIKGKLTDPSKRWFSNTNNFYMKNDLNFLKTYLNTLKNFSKKVNADFSIIILPYEYQTRKCDLDNLTPQRKLKNIFDDVKVKSLDFTKYFCKSNNPREKFYKFDPMHLSKKGHKLVYSQIINEINF